mmetsp:Transcript_38009/g.82684  ORF Transcript_38009/g.82684 Transcript_38009/m.82684 type:complete len:401 (-) Transcript_38009:52-1254(-)
MISITSHSRRAGGYRLASVALQTADKSSSSMLSITRSRLPLTRQYSTGVSRFCNQCSHRKTAANQVRLGGAQSVFARSIVRFGNQQRALAGKPTRKERKAMARAKSRRNRDSISSSATATVEAGSNGASRSASANSLKQRRRRRPWPNRKQVQYIALRVPPLLLLTYGLMLSSDHPQYGYKYGMSPGGVSMCVGPSMTPSLRHFDVVVRETLSYRMLPDMLRRELKVGDIVVYVVDTDRGLFGCRFVTKRIVATGGMAVDRLGQYADWYSKDINHGILPDPNNTSEMVQDEDYVKVYGHQTNQNKCIEKRIIVVPEGHVWLEGDAPLYSIDSRHYGPVPTGKIRGRIVGRAWPWKRDGEHDGLSISAKRPDPLSVEELVGGKYGFVKAPPTAAEASMSAT